jgi:acetoin utilization deacetylase AcuC-like enzyme
MERSLPDPTNCRSVLTYDPRFLRYGFGPDHPWQSQRLAALLDLLTTTGAWQEGSPAHMRPTPATRDELLLAHNEHYIEAVQRLGSKLAAGATLDPDDYAAGERAGLGAGDTPAFADMHEITALIAGASLGAARAVMRGEANHAFNPGGGLHHALARRASGFCVYNDIAVAIAALLREFEAKVLYVDFDAHHGDGVQWAFYDDPRVLTISFHETGRFLFPGTGDVIEQGRGAGHGYCVNVPVEAFTEDDSWRECIIAILPPLVALFKPDIIVSQHGCDGHEWDPLTDLSLTTRVMAWQTALVHNLAHQYCDGRWLAVGGGGYDAFRVVPRAWSLVWAELTQRPLPAAIPQEWLDRWQPQADGPLPPAFLDRPDDFPPKPRRTIITSQNRRTVTTVRSMLLPVPARQAFPAARSAGGLPDLMLQLTGATIEPRVEQVETPRGTVLLRDWCPPSLLERLRPDPGLHAFARFPEREHSLLARIAGRPDSDLAIAHTPDGRIVAQVTICGPDEWWEGIEGLYEVAIEVSVDWRHYGLAKRILHFALRPPYFERLILFALGYSWHWDLDHAGMDEFQYREMLRRLFASVGFSEYRTTDPDIWMNPANILLARIGSEVDPEMAQRFKEKLVAPRQPWG